MLEECDAFIITDWNQDETLEGIHTMAITIKKEVVDGKVQYTAVRHNDQQGFTEAVGIEDILKLFEEYTYKLDTNGNRVPVHDGSIKITGVKKK